MKSVYLKEETGSDGAKNDSRPPNQGHEADFKKMPVSFSLFDLYRCVLVTWSQLSLYDWPASTSTFACAWRECIGVGARDHLGGGGACWGGGGGGEIQMHVASVLKKKSLREIHVVLPDYYFFFFHDGASWKILGRFRTPMGRGLNAK